MTHYKGVKLMEEFWLQLGVSGGALFVLWRVLVTTIPNAIKPMTSALKDISELLREIRAQLHAHTDTLGQIKGSFRITPPNGVPIVEKEKKEKQ